MTAYMDQGVGVDDLFGDPNGLDIGLAPPDPVAAAAAAAAVANAGTSSLPDHVTKGLPQKLDELRTCGCNRKVAWSKLGTIAYVSKDGSGIFLRHLRCNKENGKWELSDEVLLEQVYEVHRGRSIVHLSFEHTGTYLALIDAGGHITFWSASGIAINSFTGAKTASSGGDNDALQPIGATWLGVCRRSLAFQNATREGEKRWNYAAHIRPPIGPLHPQSKAGFITVTRFGLVRLMYQQPDWSWGVSMVELEKIYFSDGILSHASVASAEGNQALITTYSVSGKLSVYRLHIKWDPIPPKQNQQTPNIRPLPTFAVNLHVARVKNVWLNGIFYAPITPPPDNKESRSREPATYGLTHLEALPYVPGGQPFQPCILAVFSAPHYCHRPGVTKASVIARWTVVAPTQSLHPSFDSVLTHKTESTPKPAAILRREKDLYFDRHIVSIDYIESGCSFALTFDDGSITFYDAKTMEKATNSKDLQIVTSMADAGFEFPPDAPGMYSAFSPNACLAVMLDANHHVRLRHMEHPALQRHEEEPEEKVISRITVSLALAYARASGADSYSDDIIAVAVRNIKKESQRLSIVSEMWRALPVSVSFTDNDKEILNNQHMSPCLSMQAAFGFDSIYKIRSDAGLVAWLTLNLRQSATIFATLFKWQTIQISGPYTSSLLRLAEGNARWTLEFLKYIINDLLYLADLVAELKDPKAIRGTMNSMTPISLRLMLSTISRGFMGYLCSSIRAVSSCNETVTNATYEDYKLYNSVHEMDRKSPVPIEACLQLIERITGQVRGAFKDAESPTQDRAAAEIQLLVRGTIPVAFENAVTNILTKIMPETRSKVNKMMLVASDYSWLGICRDSNTEHFKKTRYIDIMRRSISTYNSPGIQGQAPKRRCTRCCEVNVDLTAPRSPAEYKISTRLGILKTCFCGGMWVVEGLEHFEAMRRLREGEIDVHR